jgi:hypothetical protein
LEQRVNRLEQTLLQQQTTLEELKAQRLMSRLTVLTTERQESPADDASLAASASSVPARVLPPEPPPPGAILPMIAPPTVSADANSADTAPMPPRWGSWLQSVAELRLLITMYFDPHYRISRLTHFGLIALAGWLVFNYFFFAVWFAVPVVSPVIERLLVVVATLIAHKLLKIELIRYRRVRDYMSRWYHR